MNDKIAQLAKIYGKRPEEIIEQLADQALQNGPPAVSELTNEESKNRKPGRSWP